MDATSTSIGGCKLLTLSPCEFQPSTKYTVSPFLFVPSRRNIAPSSLNSDGHGRCPTICFWWEADAKMLPRSRRPRQLPPRLAWAPFMTRARPSLSSAGIKTNSAAHPTGSSSIFGVIQGVGRSLITPSGVKLTECEKLGRSARALRCKRSATIAQLYFEHGCNRSTSRLSKMLVLTQQRYTSNLEDLHATRVLWPTVSQLNVAVSKSHGCPTLGYKTTGGEIEAVE
ncbi:hypothetical protein DFH06DRAFT_1182121 [Mycena polygramma]|nr:hypothetical protein DFH06DRAFT_1182121 [Mycena polygramma]